MEKKQNNLTPVNLLNVFNALWKWTLLSLIFLPHVCMHIITSHSHAFWIVNGWSKERAFTKSGESANTSLALIKFNRRTVHSVFVKVWFLNVGDVIVQLSSFTTLTSQTLKCSWTHQQGPFSELHYHATITWLHLNIEVGSLKPYSMLLKWLAAV